METIQCAACGAKYKLNDSITGKKLRCSKCQAVIVVPAGADVSPGAPRAKGAASEPVHFSDMLAAENAVQAALLPIAAVQMSPKPRRPRRPVQRLFGIPVWVIGLCAFVAVVGLGILFGVLFSSANYGPPKPQPSVTILPPINGNGTRIPSATDSMTVNSGAMTSGSTGTAEFRPDGVAPRKVQPILIELPVFVTDPLYRTGKIYYPDRPFPFAYYEWADTAPWSEQKYRRVWNLETGKVVGDMLVDSGSSGIDDLFFTHLTIGPDGSVAAVNGAVWAWQPASRRLVTIPGSRNQSVQRLFFRDSDHLIAVVMTLIQGGPPKQVFIYDLRNPQTPTIFNWPNLSTAEWAISPGGRYLACASYEDLTVVDLTTQGVVAHYPIPRAKWKNEKSGFSARVYDVAFSQDGAEVGVVWDPLESTCRHASLSIL